MHIIIDGRCITENMHGIGRVAINLTGNLFKIDRENNYTLLLQTHGLRWFKEVPQNVKIKLINIPPYSIKEQLLLPRILKNLDFDLYYTPNYTAPVLLDKPIIFTIHDLIHLIYPRDYTFLHRIYYNVIIRKLCEKSLKIITVSDSSKKDIMKFFNVVPEKIIVNYNGVDEKFSPGDKNLAIRFIEEHFGINPPFLLWVGNPKPHKNLKNTLRAFEILGKKFPDLKLVLVGAEHIEIESRGKIYPINVNADDQIINLYRSAEVLVAPSYYEGFCLPVLEAFACGCPVVTSARGSIPEIAGDAAFYADPNNPEDIAEGIHKIMTDSEYRRQLIVRGNERAKVFSWQEGARRILDVFNGSG